MAGAESRGADLLLGLGFALGGTRLDGPGLHVFTGGALARLTGSYPGCKTARALKRMGDGEAEARVTALLEKRREQLAQIREALRPQADAVVVSSPNAVAVRMTSGATATLGTPTDLAKKFALVQQLLPTGAQQINVSVPERPALQGIPVPPAG